MITTSLIEKMLVRDEQTNELYLPLKFRVVLKQKQEMFYEPLDFKNNLTVDALVDSRALVSVFARNDSETKKNRKPPKKFFKMDDPLNYKLQVANRLIKKPFATAILQFEIGDNRIAESFVVMEKLTGQILGLRFMRNNSVVIDITHRLIHLTLRVKTTSS